MQGEDDADEELEQENYKTLIFNFYFHSIG